MANFSQKKQEFAAQMIATADQALLLAQRVEALDAAYNVNAFNAGAANAFVDADFNEANRHLTATAVADVMFALGTLNAALTDGVKNSLRKALTGGLP
jgi:hypothetical protein